MQRGTSLDKECNILGVRTSLKITPWVADELLEFFNQVRKSTSAQKMLLKPQGIAVK